MPKLNNMKNVPACTVGSSSGYIEGLAVFILAIFFFFFWCRDLSSPSEDCLWVRALNILEFSKKDPPSLEPELVVLTHQQSLPCDAGLIAWSTCLFGIYLLWCLLRRLGVVIKVQTLFRTTPMGYPSFRGLIRPEFFVMTTSHPTFSFAWSCMCLSLPAQVLPLSTPRLLSR